MTEFFKPSPALAKKLGKYHSRFSGARLDICPDHTPSRFFEPINWFYVQKSVQIRLQRMAWTVVYRLVYNTYGDDVWIMIEKGLFTEYFKKEILVDLNFKNNRRAEMLLRAIAEEFQNWLKFLGGSYVFSVSEKNWVAKLQIENDKVVMRIEGKPVIIPKADRKRARSLLHPEIDTEIE